MMWSFLILLAALGDSRTWAVQLEFSLNEGNACPEMPNYPKSTCKRQCTEIIQSHIRRNTLTHESVVHCNVAEQLVCCPNHPPQNPFSNQLQALTHSAAESDAQPDAQKTYPHMAALRYLDPVTLDSYIYRCAAVVIKQNVVLTSAYCAGLDDIIQQPNRVRLGLVPPFKEELPINGSSNYNSDIVLFRLTRNYSKEAMAKICSQQDLDSSRKLMAVGFAQRNGVNCEWFEQEVSLRPFSTCNITVWSQMRSVEGQTHFCVHPIHMPATPRSGSCVRCLRAGASVLHAVHADGSACVAGVATPTGGKCYRSGNATLYYSSLVNGNVLDFINSSH
ncbi:uncharacterized protein LOC6525795 [Drosophila yakuba]|uniref:Uncharacterized protein n=1 Tax=Drosophila yakuba TaxID=7245 RepID=B4Q2Z0_DROYA|nr:uncharacterized protein LOC6525795 [Drosophila yakuba]EDX02724.2 uncharacterized protein Dyak_GE15523 [Drosophila yakuba]